MVVSKGKNRPIDTTIISFFNYNFTYRIQELKLQNIQGS